MSETLKITLIQTALHWENKAENLKMFSEKIVSIKEETDLILLPEMFSTGFTMSANTLAELTDGPTLQWMKKIAVEKSCVITGSVIITEEGKYYNRLIWMRADGTYEHYDKRHMFRLAAEGHAFSPGK